jgi:hypothetical protein
MQFSQQQLSGGALYGPRTRVGNWFEDIVLQVCASRGGAAMGGGDRPCYEGQGTCVV